MWSTAALFWWPLSYFSRAAGGKKPCYSLTLTAVRCFFFLLFLLSEWKETSPFMSDALNMTHHKTSTGSSCYFGSKKNSNVCSLTSSFPLQSQLWEQINLVWNFPTLLKYRLFTFAGNFAERAVRVEWIWCVFKMKQKRVMMMIWHGEAKCQVKV